MVDDQHWDLAGGWHNQSFRWDDPRPWCKQKAPHLSFLRRPLPELDEQARDGLMSVLRGEPLQDWQRRWGWLPDAEADG